MTHSSSMEFTETTLVDGQIIMPFYLIADVSGSMTNDMTTLGNAIDGLIQTVRRDPVSDDLAMLSIITFNHSAQTIVPLGSPSELVLPQLSSGGGTNYGAAFHEFHRSFEQDRARLKSQGMKVYRPCVFFLTDGAPGDQDYAETFRSLFAYDPATKTGNQAFPYFVPYGFRSATKEVMSRLAYPDFGPTKGRWFLSGSDRVEDVLTSMGEMLSRTVISSGLSAAQGLPQIVPPAPAADPTMQFGEAGGLV